MRDLYRNKRSGEVVTAITVDKRGVLETCPGILIHVVPDLPANPYILLQTDFADRFVKMTPEEVYIWVKASEVPDPPPPKVTGRGKGKSTPILTTPKRKKAKEPVNAT